MRKSRPNEGYVPLILNSPELLNGREKNLFLSGLNLTIYTQDLKIDRMKDDAITVNHHPSMQFLYNYDVLSFP